MTTRRDPEAMAGEARSGDASGRVEVDVGSFLWCEVVKKTNLESVEAEVGWFPR